MKQNTFINNIALALLLFAVVGLGGCLVVSSGDSGGRVAPPRTQLQTRQYQQREFDTANVKLIMKAALNVLQDDGFTVKNAVVDLGLLSAIKETQIQGNSSSSRSSSSGSDDVWEEIFRSMLGGKRGTNTQRNRAADPVRFAKFKTVEATVNINEFGANQTRVRISFVAKIMDNMGDPMEVYEVDDMKFYQDFFVKMDKGIFIQKQKL